MDLSQFKVRSFVIGLIVLGVLITLASWGISKIYTFYSSSASKPKVVTITNPTPTSRISLATSAPTPTSVQNRAYATPTPRPTSRPTTAPQTSQTTTKGGIAAQPSTGSDTIDVQNPGINIYTPANNDTVASPLKVTGSGNVTSQKITLQVLDKNGYVLGTESADVCYGTNACQFETYINYAHPFTAQGYLYAYTINSLGQKAYETIVPITF